MKTTQQTPGRSSKAAQFFTALALAALLVGATGGGAAFMIYRSFNAMPSDDAKLATARRPQTVQMAANRGTLPDHENITSDAPDFRRVDNTVLSPVAARRVIAAWRSNPVVSSAPAPLTTTPEEASVQASNRPPLSDPESRYIVSAETGRVLGVDGTKGAQMEVRRAEAVAIQNPNPEVRIATAVQVRRAQPVETGETEYGYVQDDNTRYVPVRRAQSAPAAGSFDATDYLAREDSRRMTARGQAANPNSRAAGFRYDFSLPDSGNR